MRPLSRLRTKSEASYRRERCWRHELVGPTAFDPLRMFSSQRYIVRMELPLDPKLALANLPFGSSRAEVRAFLGGEPQLFRRSHASRDSDYWAALGLFAYYDEADNLEALELAAPASPSLAGEVLTSLPLQKAKRVLERHDDTMEDETDGAISKALGIGLWSEAGMDGMVQAVIRFSAGYYD